MFSSFRAHWKLHGWTGGCIPGLIAGKNKRWFISNRVAFPPSSPSSTRCTLPEFLKYGGGRKAGNWAKSIPGQIYVRTGTKVRTWSVHTPPPLGRINFRQPKGRNGRQGRGRGREDLEAGGHRPTMPISAREPMPFHLMNTQVCSSISRCVEEGRRKGGSMGEPVCYYCT